MSYRGLSRGDPGFFGSALKFVGGAIKGGISSFITGGNPIGGAISGGVRSLLTPSTAQPVLTSTFPGGAPRLLGPGPGTAVVGTRSPLGTVGVCGPGMRLKKDGGCTNRKRPTMNPMNRRAANRAINRIKGARRILHQIEISLPKRKATGGPRRKGCGCK